MGLLTTALCVFVVLLCRFNGVRHMQIYEEGGVCGFSMKSLDFPTLEELVLHYTKNDLSKHNAKLNTSLKYPIGVPP